jgi:hypothetical protein
MFDEASTWLAPAIMQDVCARYDLNRDGLTRVLVGQNDAASLSSAPCLRAGEWPHHALWPGEALRPMAAAPGLCGGKRAPSDDGLAGSRPQAGSLA